MKLKQKRSFPLKKVLIVTLIVLIIAAPIAYFLFKDTFNKNAAKTTDTAKIDYSKPTEEQKKAGEQADKEADKNNNSNNNSSQPSPSPTPTQKKPTSVSITSALQDGAGTLKVRSVISISDATPGTCTVTVAQGTTTLFSATAKSEKRSEYSTCLGFDITKAQMKNAAGQVTVTLNYSGAEYEGSASTQATLQ